MSMNDQMLLQQHPHPHVLYCTVLLYHQIHHHHHHHQSTHYCHHHYFHQEDWEWRGWEGRVLTEPSSGRWVKRCQAWSLVPETGGPRMPATPLKIHRRPKALVSCLRLSRSTMMMEVRAMNGAGEITHVRLMWVRVRVVDVSNCKCLSLRCLSS